MENARRKPNAIYGLIATHLVVGLLGLVTTVNSSPPNLIGIGFIGLVYAQASLLGCWASLSNMRLRRRVLGLLLGLIALTIELALIMRFEVELLYSLWGIFFISVVCCLAYRHFRQVAIYRQQATITDADCKWQFSIRQLMLLTFAVSCILVGRGWMQNFVERREYEHQMIFVFMTVFLAGLGLGCFWAMLKSGWPVFRCVATLVLAGVLTDLFARLISRDVIEISIILMFGQAVILLSTLFVVRRSGYRLGRVESLVDESSVTETFSEPKLSADMREISTSFEE